MNTTPMSNPSGKLLIILTPGFAANEDDTTCLPLQQQLVLAINRQFPQWQIIIVAFQYPFVKKTYRWFGNEVIGCGGKNRGNLRRLLLRLRVLKQLREISRNKKIDGILSFWLGECALVGKRFSDKNNIRHFCWLLGQDARAGNRYALKISFNGNELVALSDFLRAEFESNYKVRPGHVIPPGIVDVRLFKEKAQRDIDLLAVGSLIPLKRFGLFVEAVGTLAKTFPSLKAVIIGQGPEEDAIKKQTKLAGLQNNIEFAGKLPYDQVLEHMSRAKILFHPSSYEGFSGVCQEALACGARVISFCKPMQDDIPGWIIIQSIGEMKEVAIAILADAGYINHKPIFNHSISLTAERIIALFDDIIAQTVN
jgi:glycosyltransferase involved in cell wall biosynthesis